MAVRSRRLWGPVACGAGATTLVYTVPAGRTAVVRALGIAQSTGTAGLVAIRLTSSTGPVVWSGTSFVPGAFILPDFVFDPGDAVYCQTGASTAVWCGGYGALLLGAPS